MPQTDAPARMPVIFAGHGSPMNVIEDNRWSRGFAGLGQGAPTPRAILAISAHWFVDGTHVTAQARPKTIHDFSGFPPALYTIEYPAPGSPDLARRVGELLDADPDVSWGLDHGTWSVLRWMYPQADIPVVQLSIDGTATPQQHHDLGRALAPLRDEGVLILASGNITHNLRDAFSRMRSGSTDTPPWASRFDAAVAEAVTGRDVARLLTLWPDTEDGRLAHPSPDHWLPLLYAHGATDDDDTARYPVEGFDVGSLSMRCIVWG